MDVLRDGFGGEHLHVQLDFFPGHIPIDVFYSSCFTL